MRGSSPPGRPPRSSRRSSATGWWTCSACRLATSIGLTTGCQMAHFVCLAAARHAVLERVGWSVEDDGLFGAPEITRRRRVGDARDDPDGAAVPGPRSLEDRDRRQRRPGSDPARCARGRAADRCRTRHRRPAGRQREQRCVRPARSGDRADPRATSACVGPRRRCVRPVGCGGPGAAPPAGGPRPRGFVGDRRPQVAERARTTAGTPSSGTRSPTPPRCRHRAPPTSPTGSRSATRSGGCPSTHGERAASRPTRPCARWGATASRSSSIAAARWPDGWPIGCARPGTASRS